MARRTTPGTKQKKSNRIWEQINQNAAGIDAGAEYHYVAIPEDRATPAVRRFWTNTMGLYELADWLVENGIDTVAARSNGRVLRAAARSVGRARPAGRASQAIESEVGQ